jgi:hypothetical protein
LIDIFAAFLEIQGDRILSAEICARDMNTRDVGTIPFNSQDRLPHAMNFWNAIPLAAWENR